tara:strand:+ start:1436 stop:2548 length:1113 start_codon:yes stop_codon:yes gene_type:complete
MASSFKSLTNNDVTSTRTLLHEAIPMTGALVSGTYNDHNIKDFSHGMFQSVYDYPYLSSSANHLFDITFGHSSVVQNSSFSQNTKKSNIYNQMAQVLVGHDVTGGIRKFDQDGNFSTGGNAQANRKFHQAFFFSFSRLLTKDEIKKGSFTMSFITGSEVGEIGISKSDVAGVLSISDHGAQNSYFVNSPAGEYGLLLTGANAHPETALGHVYYQAGVAVVTASVFGHKRVVGSQADGPGPGLATASFGITNVGSKSSYVYRYVTGSTIQNIANSVRRRVSNIQFNNTTELNSTIYYCRAHHNEYNYSSNPSYISDSKLVVKNISTDTPVSYITTVGLYSADNELLAVAKLSEPLKKDPTTEFTLRVRLDY